MMPLSEIFALGIVFYLLYRFVFHFLLPIFKVTRQVQGQFRDMRDRAQQQQGGPFYQQQSERPQGPYSQSNPASSRPSSRDNTAGDYIDFEEIK